MILLDLRIDRSVAIRKDSYIGDLKNLSRHAPAQSDTPSPRQKSTLIRWCRGIFALLLLISLPLSLALSDEVEHDGARELVVRCSPAFARFEDVDGVP